MGGADSSGMATRPGRAGAEAVCRVEVCFAAGFVVVAVAVVEAVWAAALPARRVRVRKMVRMVFP